MTNKILQKTLELLNEDQKSELFKSILSDEVSVIQPDISWEKTLDNVDYSQDKLTTLFSLLEEENYKEALSIISQLLVIQICNGN